MSQAMFTTVTDHLVAALPNEGVGLLGAVVDGDFFRTVAFFPGTNIDQSPTRYTMDPAEVLSAFRVMGAKGWRLGAIVHSHVGSSPTPSVTDLREAYYPDALLLIVGLGQDEVDASLWRPMVVAAGPIAADLILDPSV